MVGGGRYADDHNRLAVTAQREFEQPREFAVAVRDMTGRAARLAQCVDAIAEC